MRYWSKPSAWRGNFHYRFIAKIWRVGDLLHHSSLSFETTIYLKNIKLEIHMPDTYLFSHEWLSRNVVVHHKPLPIFAHTILVGTSNQQYTTQSNSNPKGRGLHAHGTFLFGLCVRLYVPSNNNLVQCPKWIIKKKHAMESSSLMTKNTCFKTK